MLTFSEEFSTSEATFWTGWGGGGTWATSYLPHLDDTRYLVSNAVKHYFVDDDDPDLASLFTFADGAVTITTMPVVAGQESRADVPDEQGFWSSFWLLPSDDDWPAEIDVFEILGDDTTVVNQTSVSMVRQTKDRLPLLMLVTAIIFLGCCGPNRRWNGT